jgi:hypothetical protein
LARLLLTAALLAAFGASAAQAQLRPSSAEEIGAAVRDCAAATTRDLVAEQTLVAFGWSKGSFLKDDKPVETPLSVFGKTGTNPIIMTDSTLSTSPGKVCIVIAGLKRTSDYRGVIDVIDSLPNTAPIRSNDLEIILSNGKQVFMTALTGSREKPSVRISVVAVAAAKSGN